MEGLTLVVASAIVLTGASNFTVAMPRFRPSWGEIIAALTLWSVGLALLVTGIVKAL